MSWFAAPRVISILRETGTRETTTLSLFYPALSLYFLPSLSVRLCPLISILCLSKPACSSAEWKTSVPYGHMSLHQRNKRGAVVIVPFGPEKGLNKVRTLLEVAVKGFLPIQTPKASREAHPYRTNKQAGTIVMRIKSTKPAESRSERLRKPLSRGQGIVAIW